MLVFCKGVSFLRWLGFFARESRCQFQCRSSRARTTHTPCRCPSSSSEKAYRSSLLRSARPCEKRRSADAAAHLSPSSVTARAFREALILLSSRADRDRRNPVWLNPRRIPVPPRLGFVPATDRNH